MATLANTAAERTKSTVNAGVNAAANYIDSDVMDQVKHLREEAMDAYKTSEKYIRANPFYFIGGAAVLGLVSGILLARKH